MRNILSVSYRSIFAIGIFIALLAASCNKYLESETEKTGVLDEQTYFKEIEKLRTHPPKKNARSIGLSGIQELSARFEEYDYPCWERIKVYSDIDALSEKDHFLYSIHSQEVALRKEPSSQRLTIFEKTKPVLEKAQAFSMEKYGKSIYRLGDKEFKAVLTGINYKDAMRAVLTPEELIIINFK